jgi:hypothetical protein
LIFLKQKKVARMLPKKEKSLPSCDKHQFLENKSYQKISFELKLTYLNSHLILLFHIIFVECFFRNLPRASHFAEWFNKVLMENLISKYSKYSKVFSVKGATQTFYCFNVTEHFRFYYYAAKFVIWQCMINHLCLQWIFVYFH